MPAAKALWDHAGRIGIYYEGVSMKRIKRLLIVLLTFVAILSLTAYGPKEEAAGTPTKEDYPEDKITDAIFLGVENYGAEEINKDTKDTFFYRFDIEGEKISLRIDNGTENADETFDYPIQNCLKEGYAYELQIKNGIVTAAKELKTAVPEKYEPPVIGIPGKRTLKNFLATAFMPVGTTLYIYGGGWNWQDNGSAIQARTIGVSDDWIRFFLSQDANFTYREKDGNEALKDPANSYYPYGGYNEDYYAGLDCSGYVGWTVYNIMNTENGKDGYVMGASKTARAFAENGWGTWTREIPSSTDQKTVSFLPGDIFSISGHVWICIGACEDGSILLLHSTPAESRTGQPGGGPELSALGRDKTCDAYLLADHYMSRYFPDWYERYPVALKDYEKYTFFEEENTGRFSWNLTGENGGLLDPDGYSRMTPEEILEDLFPDVN